MKGSRYLLASALLTLTALISSSAHAESVWKRVGVAHGIDPLLLYAIALQESRNLFPQGLARPWPWTLNTPSKGGRFFSDEESARAELQSLLQTDVKNIDIGLMQVNWRWNGHLVNDAIELLDPVKNLEVAAKILRQCVDEQGGDVRKSIARYHTALNTPKRRERGYAYADKVLDILRRLNETEAANLLK
jgi:soluble lytic murein transglycosylase-like protein